MEVLVLRLALSVTTTLSITILQRRFGHRLGGRLMGLPMTMAPLTLILYLTDGRAVAAQAALSGTAGQLVVAAFCLGYGRARRRPGPAAALATALALSLSALALVYGIDSTPISAMLIAAVVGAGLMLWPPVTAPIAARAPAGWVTPLRLLTTASVIMGLTSAARVLGPHVAGLLASLPVVLSILATTTHHTNGFPAAASLLRGTLRSVPGTVVFGLILAYGLASFRIVSFEVAVVFGVACVGLFATDQIVGHLRRWSAIVIPNTLRQYPNTVPNTTEKAPTR
ncbi:hypothetical protein [Nocardia alni]|uniref:hypothetical protein n=1 Tax=Nocardia alni TaxID=2815723 RepID=UPI001C249A92|nr:hypothetical protein [Nocardia alni]